MVKVIVYPSCLKCVCPKFVVMENEDTMNYPMSASYSVRDNSIMCDNVLICKFVEGQEPIDMAKNNCTLTYNGEISGTDAPSYVCSVCGYEENLDTAKFCGGCGSRVADIAKTVRTVSEAETTKKRCHDIETIFNGFEWSARCKKCGSRVCEYVTEDKAINALEDMPCK